MNARSRRSGSLSNLPRSIPNSENVVELLEAVYPGTKQAFDTLVEKGADAIEMKRRLWMNLIRLEGRGKVSERLPLGMPRYMVKRLPKRLEKIAGIIDKINESPVLSPHIWRAPEGLLGSLSDEEKSELGRKWDELGSLPHRLRMYAKYLNAQLGVVRDLSRKDWWMTVGRYQFDLIEFVRKSTGRHYYEQVADLLTAVYHGAGSDTCVVADRLKMLYKRGKSRR